MKLHSYLAHTALVGLVTGWMPVADAQEITRHETRSGTPESAAAPSVAPAEARTIAEEGFIYGLPMVMRLYWPKTEPPSILPPGKGTWSPPKVVVAD